MCFGLLHIVLQLESEGWVCLPVTLCVKARFFWSKDIFCCVLLHSKHLLEVPFSIQSHWWYWVVSFILCYTQGLWLYFQCCMCVCISLWFAGLSFFSFWMCSWCCDRKWGGIWVLISHFGLGLQYFCGQTGFSRAVLTAKKQAVPSPATTSTKHRSTQKSVALIPLFRLFAVLKLAISEFCEATHWFCRV